MRLRSALLRLIILCAALLPVGCGGGGVGGSGLAVGPVQSSDGTTVVVQGVRFETDAATITVNGEPASQEALSSGVFVTVSGTIDSRARFGTAEIIEVEQGLRGLVSSVDSTGGTLSALRMDVVVDGSTVVDGPALDAIDVGSTVAASGPFDADDRLIATHLATVSSANDFVLRGKIGDLDRARSRFRLRSLEIEFGSALVVGAGQDGPGTGDHVQIQFQKAAVDPILVRADVVRVLDPTALGQAGATALVDGIVDERLSSLEFRLTDGRVVRIVAGTEVSNGTEADLQANAGVTVRGVLAEDGTLDADSIDID